MVFVGQNALHVVGRDAACGCVEVDDVGFVGTLVVLRLSIFVGHGIEGVEVAVHDRSAEGGELREQDIDLGVAVKPSGRFPEVVMIDFGDAFPGIGGTCGALLFHSALQKNDVVLRDQAFPHGVVDPDVRVVTDRPAC